MSDDNDHANVGKGVIRQAALRVKHFARHGLGVCPLALIHQVHAPLHERVQSVNMVRALDTELAVRPLPETAQLYDDVRAGRLAPAEFRELGRRLAC